MWAEIAHILGRGANRSRDDDQQEEDHPEGGDLELAGLRIIGD
jgi:hypothetical protein